MRLGLRVTNLEFDHSNYTYPVEVTLSGDSYPYGAELTYYTTVEEAPPLGKYIDVVLQDPKDAASIREPAVINLYEKIVGLNA